MFGLIQVYHMTVVIPRGYDRPVDLYLEGSDQHRVVSITSLMTSCKYKR